MHRWAPSSFLIDNEVFYFGGITYVGEDNGDMWKFDLNSVQCLAATGHTAVSIEETSVGLFFTSSPTGSTDTLQWRVSGDIEWTSIPNPTSLFQLSELTPYTDYEFRLNYGCNTGGSVYTDVKSFSTKGCGACIDNSYCNVGDDYYALNCYIDRIKINNDENISGDNEGFEEFISSDQASVVQGELLEVEINPGYSGSIQDGGVKVWLDLDFNGEYSSDELILEDASVSNLYSGEFEIPTDIQDGITRMRIIFDINDVEGPCNNSFWSDGEVEDYCVTIGGGLTDLMDVKEEITIVVHPNPASQFISLEFDTQEVQKLTIYDIEGNMVQEIDIDFERIDIGSLDNGIYFLKLVANDLVSSAKIIKQN